MVTEEKIKIFKRYDGNIDSWAKSGSIKEKLVMTDDDWYTIDAFIQDLFIVKKGLASIEFKDTLNVKLRLNCNGENTINQLNQLADHI